VADRGERFPFAFVAGLVALCLVAAGCSSGESGDQAGTSVPSSDATTPVAPDVDALLSADGADIVARVDPRYQSYNIEMVEVTGGTFWAPYDEPDNQALRPPIELESERLRNLARELGPAYIRVSGTAANSTYFDEDASTGGIAPEGFRNVLTPEQWRGVGEFAAAVDGEIVTSFAVDTGVRDAAGVWLDDQARSLMQFSIDNDIPIAGAEFYNEPSLNLGVPGGYDAAAYARDFATFERLASELLPDMTIAGPGSVDDITPLLGIPPPILAEDILTAVGPAFDAFSYHFYPKLSERCRSEEGPEVALTEEFLTRVETDAGFYEGLRDTYQPDAPMWITETAQASCGGDRWAAQYLDVIRYVDQLGRLANGDGDVVFHNTLAGSDYGLLDEDGFEPHPNYWAAVLWNRLVGEAVLDVAPVDAVDGLSVHAHCTAEDGGAGVTFVAVNASGTDERSVGTASGTAEVYLLTSDDLAAGSVSLNGATLTAAPDGTLPPLDPQVVHGPVVLPPASVAFIVDSTSADACAGE
jgi:hypothetical protein